ncbi:hypothetical protein [Bacteroides thetaiotaomicron]|nr:hypothetical protein [Bacteroides thetaiotaomicron]MCS3044273.1 hypothetical protein [Bacteroides thetaiotaomicron]
MEGKVSGIWWFTSYHFTATGWNTSGLTQKDCGCYYMNDGSN